LERVNKRALRFILNDKISRYELLLKKTKTVSLNDRRTQDMLIIKQVYKSLNNEAPTYIRELLQDRAYTSLRVVRKLKLPKVRTTKYGLNSFRYCAPKQWDSLSDIERTAKKLECF
jgi:hypothetical protein